MGKLKIEVFKFKLVVEVTDIFLLISNRETQILATHLFEDRILNGLSNFRQCLILVAVSYSLPSLDLC